jgi:zinc/manganese transport system substrate-binding protein
MKQFDLNQSSRRRSLSLCNPYAFLLSFLFLAGTQPAWAQTSRLKVVTTLPDLAALFVEIGGDAVEVRSLLKGIEDPHYADAVPEYIRLVASADVVCLMGLDLEVGWMPKVLSKSGNSKVQPGAKGYCEGASSVKALDRVTGRVDRSMGDVHPAGNPHFNLSPLSMIEASTAITRVLSTVAPGRAEVFQRNQESLVRRLRDLHSRLQERIKNSSRLRVPVVMEYHKEFVYFFNAYGLKSLGSLEEKPGVPPSAGRIAQVALQAKASGVTAIFAAPSSPQRTLVKFSELSGVSIRRVPAAASSDEKGFAALESLQTRLVEALLEKP